MTAPIQIFDSRGQLRRDFDPAEIAALSPDDQTLLEAMIAATIDESEATDAVRDAERGLREALDKRERAVAAHAKAHPAPTPLEALRAVQAAQRAARI